MRLFAISDLHLAFRVRKPMDVFGAHWREHHEKIRVAWESCVSDEDVVLVPGDVSWATRPADVTVDLEWISDLPGTKIFVKGNHDYWWPKTRRKLDQLMPERIRVVDRDAITLGGVAFLGGRGCDFDPPWGPIDSKMAGRALERESERLENSITALRKLRLPESTPRVALLHYPPFPPNSDRSVFTDMLEKAGVRVCVFGHLHTQEDFDSVFQGTVRGITYRLVSCDYLDFHPLEVRL